MAKKKSDVLTVQEIAEFLDVSRPQAQYFINTGVLKATKKKIGKWWSNVVPRKDVEALAKKRGQLREVQSAAPKKNSGEAGDPVADEVLTFLKKSKRRKWTSTFDELVEAVDRSPARVRKALESLRERGMNVVLGGDEGGATEVGLSGDVRPGAGEPLIVHPEKFWNNRWYEFGLTGDNHLGSKHERLDVLNALYDMYHAEGITDVYNTGNMIEGESRLNFHDIKVFTLDGQIQYWIDNYPSRPGITTHFVTGDDHEGWYQKKMGMEIGRYMEQAARDAGRQDLNYLGYVEADICFRAKEGERLMRVMHPGGGAAYALSYSAQKLVESFQGGEKPSIFAYGHYHKFDYNFYREVYCIGTGCTVDQSIFMRKQKIQAHVGGCRVKLNQAPDGQITRLAVEWMSFYDRGYYTKPRKF